MTLRCEGQQVERGRVPGRWVFGGIANMLKGDEHQVCESLVAATTCLKGMSIKYVSHWWQGQHA
jgi:hypothetical protein